MGGGSVPAETAVSRNRSGGNRAGKTPAKFRKPRIGWRMGAALCAAPPLCAQRDAAISLAVAHAPLLLLFEGGRLPASASVTTSPASAEHFLVLLAVPFPRTMML